MYEKLFEQFEALRSERLSIIEPMLEGDDLDQCLADIANIAAIIYAGRKLSQMRNGFKSNSNYEKT